MLGGSPFGERLKTWPFSHMRKDFRTAGPKLIVQKGIPNRNVRNRNLATGYGNEPDGGPPVVTRS